MSSISVPPMAAMPDIPRRSRQAARAHEGLAQGTAREPGHGQDMAGRPDKSDEIAHGSASVNLARVAIMSARTWCRASVDLGCAGQELILGAKVGPAMVTEPGWSGGASTARSASISAVPLLMTRRRTCRFPGSARRFSRAAGRRPPARRVRLGHGPAPARRRSPDRRWARW
jgi:hypothetical protein